MAAPRDQTASAREGASRGWEPTSVLKPSGSAERRAWDGPTYYGRQQLKPAPFHKSLVGGYIFLAGLSGSASLIGGLAGVLGGAAFRGVARRARSLALLAPTIGSVLLIQDLHTPKRFYNMLRVAKARSPMSIGTWILGAFSGAAFPAALAGALADRAGVSFARPLVGAASVPAAAAGAGLSVYTASLLSATSAPAWAAVPEPLAVRFAASSMASAAGALLIGARTHEARRALTAVGVLALGTEIAAALAQKRAYRRAGVAALEETRWGRVDQVGATYLGAALPLALLGAAAVVGPNSRAGRTLETLGAALALVGSATLRVATLGLGEASAASPDIAFRFASPDNLKDPEERRALELRPARSPAVYAHPPGADEDRGAGSGVSV